MKLYNLLIIAALLCSSSLFGQLSKTLIFNTADFDITLDANRHVDIMPHDEMEYSNPNDPALPNIPYKVINVLVPKGATITSFYFTREKQILYTDATVNPCPDSEGNINTSVVYPANIYPDNSNSNVWYIGRGEMQGFEFVTLGVSPFIFYNDINKLAFNTLLTINMTLSNTNTSEILRYYNHEMIEAMVVNPSDVATYYSQAQESLLKTETSEVEYLIITSEALKNSFTSLLNWKLRKGIAAAVYTVEQISAMYSSGTMPLKIKQFLHNVYDEGDGKLHWVLLGGDNTIVPAQQCYGEYVVSENGVSVVNSDNTIPTDLFYACFDNQFDWNYNGNDRVGEDEDNVDFYPEIVVSRLPVRTTEHVTAIVNKTLQYEQAPNLQNNYINSLLLSGAQMNIPSDAEVLSGRLWDFIEDYWDGNVVRFYDTDTDFSGGAAYNVNSTNMQTQLNNGYNIVHVNTHGNPSLFQIENDDYTVSNASSLSNTTGLIITVACETNKFDDASIDPCLSEAFIRNPNGGCVMYWGSSRVGMGLKTMHSSESLVHNMWFLKVLARSDHYGHYKYGDVASFSRSIYVSSATGNTDQAKRFKWLQYSLNAIGDPELPIYTSFPQTFNPTITYYPSTNNLLVNTNEPDVKITVMSLDNGETFYTSVGSSGYIVFADVPEQCYVTITKKNFVPYVYKPQDIYLQNMDFSDTRVFESSRNIYMGSNVTSSISSGPVIFESGCSVVLDAANDIIIEGEVEFRPGSEVIFE